MFDLVNVGMVSLILLFFMLEKALDLQQNILL